MSRLRRIPAFLLALLVALPLGAQRPAVVAPPTNQAIFAPLELPAPDLLRRPGGDPGPAYWQQRADYRIDVELIPAEHRVRGRETIHYVNNSPDALPFVWVQLEQNLFAPGSRGALVNSGSRWRGFFPEGGLQLEGVAVVQDGDRYTPQVTVDGTRMRVDLARPLAPSGDGLDLDISWTFVVPEYGADRMGRYPAERGTVYELAQWYPRMYVYDDVAGWNPLPYLGQGEFYLEYGDFEVAITAPRDQVVVAGGELLNPDEVLTPDQLERYRRARTSDTTVVILGRDEVGTAASRPAGDGPLTWRYRLENARDFSWAASSAFIWDAAGWNGVLLQSAYPHEGLGDDGASGWERSTEYLLHTIPYYSETWFTYPYPSAVNVAGVVGGMEYPGIVFCGVGARDQGLFGVTDHEFGHSWFPMIVGSDERRYAWMDEGFNTFINHYSNLDFYGEAAARTRRTSGAFIAGQMQSPIADQPIMTAPDVLRREGLGFMAYRKPGYGLILLREVVLGEERFDAAFRSYIDEWAYRHPQPSDFMRHVEEVAGEDLAWFWRGWFWSTDVLDQSVTAVEDTETGTDIRLRNEAGLVMPVLLHVEFEDGTTLDRTLPVEIWMRGDDYTLSLDRKAVARVFLDPDFVLPDVDRENNEWRRVVS
ncbi:MAG TPA: M1 family metallopeptidase [Longimicrobiales bacterium]|nr:M1 family metallopeptidase [Longimicrobiales bacterium]